MRKVNRRCGRREPAGVNRARVLPWPEAGRPPRSRCARGAPDGAGIRAARAAAGTGRAGAARRRPPALSLRRLRRGSPGSCWRSSGRRTVLGRRTSCAGGRPSIGRSRSPDRRSRSRSPRSRSRAIRLRSRPGRAGMAVVAVGVVAAAMARRLCCGGRLMLRRETLVEHVVALVVAELVADVAGSRMRWPLPLAMSPGCCSCSR